LNGKLWKRVIFSNDNPVGDFHFYYESGIPKIIGIQISDVEFRILKFSEDGCIVSDEKYPISLVKQLLSAPQ
jgi:antitoxin component YwqK of YwqJK toxin-antitoxin module